MKVEKVRNRKEIQVKGYDEEDINGELSFYLADKLIQDLFLLDEISLEEYKNIRRENIKKFRPILAELML
ncbi:MAG: hypothetical protein Q4D88_02775 [Anaerococcus sp.]|nr:hypothetical protein [Anaerococcus sp.]